MLAAHLNVQLYNAMPNLLVGIGILGTFIGLLFGIHVASKGLAASDMAVARGALQGLLSAAALKFSTSVAGLLASLLFAWREKRWIYRFESLASRFAAALEMRLERVTAESIALSSLRAAARQEALLEGLPERVGETMALHLTPLIGSLVERLEHLRRDVSRNTGGGSAGEESMRIATTLERVGAALEAHTLGLRNASSVAAKEWSSSFREGSEGLQRGVAQTLTAMLERLSTAIEEMAGHLATAGATAARDLGHAASGVDAAGGRLSHALGSLETATQTFARFGSDAERLLVGLREVQMGFAATVVPVTEAAGAFRHSANRVEAFAVRVQETVEGLQTSSTEIARMENQVCHQWREYEERFANVDAALANTFHELDQGLSHTTLLVRDWVEGLDRHTASIVRELTTATVELRETVAELTELFVESKAVESKAHVRTTKRPE